MSRVAIYIDGNLQDDLPVNISDIRLSRTFRPNKNETLFNVDRLILSGESALPIFNRINSALGVFVGIPFRLVVMDDTGVFTPVDGQIDLTDNPIFIEGDTVEVKVKRLRGEDWVSERSSSISFKWLYEEKRLLTKNDFVQVPYILKPENEGFELIIMAISAYILAKELAENIERLSEAIADIIMAVTPLVGVGVVINVGAIIAKVVKAVARIVYIIAIGVALFRLFTIIFENIFPLIRYHTGIRVKRLFEVGCQHLGLTFSSTIFDSQGYSGLTFIPSKSEKGSLIRSKIQSGVPERGDAIYTFGDLINVFSEYFNADFRVTGSVVQFERRDYWRGTSNYVIDDNLEDQERRLRVKKINTNEMISEYNINYSIDLMDINTIEGVPGRVMSAITQVKDDGGDSALINLKGFKGVNIPFALSRRKDTLTEVELQLRALAAIVDKVTKIFKSPTSLASRIDARASAMLTSSHFINGGRICVMAGNGLASSQSSLISARSLWDRFHFIESFVSDYNANAQAFLYENMKTRFCKANFVDLLNNNFAKTKDGKDAEIEQVDWQVMDDVATVSYRVNEVYDTNIQLTIVE